jgi:putative proteasome-type protease
MADDEEHKLYMLYPEGNWIEIGEGSPFMIIGNSGYGKPILNRTLTYESSMKDALKTGFLSFDSTRVSANDVEFPIDVVLYKPGSFKMVEHRYEKEDLRSVSSRWAEELKSRFE